VKINNAALDIWNDDIVLRGTVDPDSFGLLQIADYQREMLTQAKIDHLKKGHLKGTLPDIVLNLRDSMAYREMGDAFYLTGDVYIVDGQQRVESGKQLMADPEYPGFNPRLGVRVHFGHDAAWELDLFDELNGSQTRLSSNINLRNLRAKLPVAKTMYNLCTDDRSFVLYRRVTFTQNAHIGELISATMFYKVVGMLHSHIGPGRGAKVTDLAEGLQKIMQTTGRNTYVSNIRTFFEALDSIWGVQHVAYRQTAVHLKLTFMLALAKVLSEHLEFWDGEKLVIDSSIIRKLKLFQTMDPTVMNLASSSGKAIDTLTYLMAEHINSGKRTRRLTRRNFMEPADTYACESDSEEL
jgi:hypothetical protein